MKEIGKVTRTEGKNAYVRMDKKGECAKCGMCLFPKNANSVEICVLNEIGAKKGDSVFVETSQKAKSISSALVFLVPLILILVSTVIGYFVLESEIWILSLSLISLLSWYAILAVIDKKLRKTSTFCSTITCIVAKGENNDKNI